MILGGGELDRGPCYRAGLRDRRVHVDRQCLWRNGGAVLDYFALKAWDFGKIRQSYTRRDTILYALGVGLGAGPLDAGQLRFVYERNLQALPTMATVLGQPGPY